MSEKAYVNFGRKGTPNMPAKKTMVLLDFEQGSDEFLRSVLGDKRNFDAKARAAAARVLERRAEAEQKESIRLQENG